MCSTLFGLASTGGGGAGGGEDQKVTIDLHHYSGNFYEHDWDGF